MDSSERKILRARLFAPAIGGAATSMIFQNGKWTGQVLAIPFRMDNAIHYFVEANGDLHHRILRSDQMSRSNAPSEANVFDQWLGIAYSERGSQHSRMVVGTSMGAGLDSAKNIRSSIGWATSQKVGRAYKTKSADPEMEALVATDLNQDEPTWKSYVDKDQPGRMVYEVTVKRAFTLHSLGKPAVTTQEQIGASAIRQKLNDADPNEIARILSRFATEPPRDPEIARIL